MPVMKAIRSITIASNTINTMETGVSGHDGSVSWMAPTDTCDVMACIEVRQHRVSWEVVVCVDVKTTVSVKLETQQLMQDMHAYWDHDLPFLTVVLW